MANRVLLGNRSTGGYGLYVSRAGKNVLICDPDDLIFSSVSTHQVDHALVIDEITSTSQSAGTTVNNSTSAAIQSGEQLFTLTTGTDTLTTSFTSGSTFSTTLASSYAGVYATNTVGTQTIRLFLFKGVPSTSLF